jgi:hypothetical protein
VGVVGPLGVIEHGGTTVTDMDRVDPPRVAMTLFGPPVDQLDMKIEPVPVPGLPTGDVIHDVSASGGQPLTLFRRNSTTWPIPAIAGNALTVKLHA